MNKTLRKKLTESHPQTLTSSLRGGNAGDISSTIATAYRIDLRDDRNILKEAAKDLLQPRPEAIARLLAMAKDI